MTREEARKLVKEHGSARAAARAAGIPKTSFQRLLAGATSQVRAKTLAEFRAQYDKSYIVPMRVRDGLRKLGNGWEYEADFAKLCGVSLSDLGRFRDQFADYVVVIGRDSRRAWAGSKATADAMREMLS